MKISILQHNNTKLLEDFVKKQRSKAIAYLQKHFYLPFNDCEDVFQDAFIVLYDNIQSGKLETMTSSLSTYFIAICRNKALEWLREKGKVITTSYEFSTVPEFTFLDQQVDKILKLDSDNENIQIKKEALVRTIVRDLPSPCDELLWGFYRDGFSMRTLAQKYNYSSENAVKVTKYRCCEKFRKRFNESIKSLF